MIRGECRFCDSVRVWRLHPVRHEPGCPTGGRRPARLASEDWTFYRHPDLAELDLSVSAWYPQLVA